MLEVHICSRNGALIRAFAVGDTPELIVGRDEECDIRIKAQNVSREHCAIEKEDDGFILRDLGSTGGTFVNGERIDRIRLEDGLEVSVGPAILKFYNNDI